MHTLHDMNLVLLISHPTPPHPHTHTALNIGPYTEQTHTTFYERKFVLQYSTCFRLQVHLALSFQADILFYFIFSFPSFYFLSSIYFPFSFCKLSPVPFDPSWGPLTNIPKAALALIYWATLTTGVLRIFMGDNTVNAFLSCKLQKASVILEKVK